MAPRNRYSEIERVGVDCSVEPSRTKQSFKDSCDINKIIKGYDKNGLITHLNEQMPQYHDMVHDGIIGGHAMDFHQAMNFVKNAEAAFAELPAELRKQFKNDPEEFLRFVDDPANQEAMVEMGLASERAIEAHGEQGTDGGTLPPAGETKASEAPESATAEGSTPASAS